MERIQLLANNLRQLSVQIAALKRSVEQLKQGMESAPSQRNTDGDTEMSQQAPKKQEAPLVYVNSALCRGCSICTQVAPNTFRISPDSGLAEVIDPAGDSRDIVQQAVARCPTGAIIYEA